MVEGERGADEGSRCSVYVVVGQEHIADDRAAEGGCAIIPEDDSAAEDVRAAGISVRASKRRIAGVSVAHLFPYFTRSADVASVNCDTVVLAHHDKCAVVSYGR